MHGEPAKVSGSSHDASRNGLEFAQRLLAGSAIPNTAELFADLAAAFAADGAGVAALAGGPLLLRRSSLAPASRWPWDADLQLSTSLRSERSARTLVHPEGGSLLAAAVPGLGHTPWLIWLESRRRTVWSETEAAAFTLAASAVARVMDAAAPRWTEQLERLAQLQQLEHAAAAVRRVAHDYGNVLTTILGFGELALAQQIPAGSALNRYLKEVRGGAESGAQLTNQLRLFSRRQTASVRPCPLQPILMEEQKRIVANTGDGAKIDLVLPPDLPPAAIDGDHLRIIVAALLNNAVEASGHTGIVTVTARTLTIAADECLDYYGDVQPGPHVEFRVTDSGPGLSPEVRKRLFAEPFFSTKPSRRGYGLFAVYGVLRSHRGGLRLGNASEQGTAARVVLPVAVMPAPPISPSALERATDRILVAAGDARLSRAVSNTLEKAGYRVESVPDAEKALAVHAAASEPIRLVLSDMVLPRGSGVELARRLLKRDAGLRVLLMADRQGGQHVPGDLAGCVGELLQKPFRPEDLLRAVRIALERGPTRRTATGAALVHEEAVGSSSR